MRDDVASNPGVRFDMTRGPFQMYGASPWYTTIGVGTPPQPMKFALDSGTNIVWSTSTLCGPTGCQHYGGSQFNYGASSSFRFIDQTRRKYSFGPWGDMVVETGADVLRTPDGRTLPVQFYLSAQYDGAQFASIDWDGGMGIPSGTAYVQPGNSFIVQDMMNAGAISPGSPFVSFGWDQASKAGNCIIGGYDPNAFDPADGIFVPWTEYTKFQGVGYIWTTPMQSWAVGDKVLAQATAAAPYWFSLDSGSSQFKGDDDLMNQTLGLVGPNAGGPPVVIALGAPNAAAIGTLTVTPPMYNAVIQTGPGKGALISQFQPLGLPGLALVGSTLMEWCYTIYEYTVSGSAGRYTLAPRGMWIFNKRGGPKVVSAGASERWDDAPRPVLDTVGAVPVSQETDVVRPGRPLVPEA